MDVENNIEIYKNKDDSINIDVNFDEDTVWLTQKQMALLFGRDSKTITRHISNIFKEEELEKKVVCSYFEHTTSHGAIAGKKQTQQTQITLEIEYYNLDIIISVENRAKVATQFHQWATQCLKEVA